MVKIRHAAWEYFIPEDEGKTRIKARCKYCGNTSFADPKRMCAHIIKCSKAPCDIQEVVQNIIDRTTEGLTRKKMNQIESYEGIREIQELQSVSNHTIEKSNSLDVSRKGIKRVEKRSRHDALHESTQPKLSKHETELAEDDFVAAMIVHDVPWSFLDNQYLQSFVKRLNPGYNMLNKNVAQTTVLGRLDTRVISATQAMFKEARCLTLQCNDLVTMTREPIMKWIAIDERRRSRLVTIERSSREMAGDGIANMVKAFVAHHITPFVNKECKLSFCSDSASSMTQVRRLLAQDKAFTLVGGCMARQSNILLKRCFASIPWATSTVDLAITIAHFIHKTTPFQTALLSVDSVSTLSHMNPTPTRWHSLGSCIKQLLLLKTSILCAADKLEQASCMMNATEIADTIKDAQFWQQLSTLDRLVSPFNLTTVLSEREDTTSSYMLLTWIWLIGLVDTSMDLSDEEKDSYRRTWLGQINRHGELHYFIALVLDPRFHGLGLTPKGKRVFNEAVLRFGTKLNLDHFELSEELSYYQGKGGMFEGEWQWSRVKTLDPVRFWMAYDDCPGLQTIALLVLSYVPHTTSCEGDWSRYKQIHSRDRYQKYTTASIARVKQHYQDTHQGTRSMRSQPVRPASDSGMNVNSRFNVLQDNDRSPNDDVEHFDNHGETRGDSSDGITMETYLNDMFEDQDEFENESIGAKCASVDDTTLELSITLNMLDLSSHSLRNIQRVLHEFVSKPTTANM